MAVQQTLAHALARLPKRQRAVLVLRFHADLSEAATAAALGINVGTVKTHTSRALAVLRADLQLRDAFIEEVPR